jgi:DNA polymerase-3 subunit delta
MVALSVASVQKFLSAPPNGVRGFLFYGSDGLQISARAEALASSLTKKSGPDAEVIRLHDTDAAAAPDRIATELNTGSLFGGTKIIWLTNLPAKAHAAVLEAAATPIEGAFLIAQAPDLKKNHKLVQSFEGASYLAAISCYGEDRDSLIAGIRNHVSSFGCEIDADAAALVAARCDFSALLARSEAEKLIAYAGPARRITSADVDDCLIDQQTAGLAEIIDHALDGEGRKATLAFERFMAAEQNVTPVFAVLSSGLLRLYALRTAVDAGAPAMQAIKELRPPVFFKQQDALAAQVRGWPAQALLAVLHRLNAVLKETRLKPGLAEDLTANFILLIARTRRKMR